jgi:type III secretion system-like peptide-binding chaperone
LASTVEEGPSLDVLAFALLAEGLTEMLERLVSDPGRWILVLTFGPGDGIYYIQYLCCEDGSMVAEAVSNRYLSEPCLLSTDNERRLVSLGWESPSDDSHPNWRVLQPTITPDVAAAARLGIDTMRCVFGVTEDDRVCLKLFSSPRRSNTPASPDPTRDE